MIATSVLVICCIIATNGATIPVPVLTPFVIEPSDYTPNTLYQFYVPINAKSVQIEITTQYCTDDNAGLAHILLSTQDRGISSDYYNQPSFSSYQTETSISLDPTFVSERQILRWTVGSFWHLGKYFAGTICRSWVTNITIDECPVGTVATPVLAMDTNVSQVICKPAQSVMLPISNYRVTSTSLLYVYFDVATTSPLTVQVKAATSDLIITGSKQGLSFFKDCTTGSPIETFGSYTYTMDCPSVPHGYWFLDITSPSGVVDAIIDVSLKQCPTGMAGPTCQDRIYQVDVATNLTVTTQSAAVTYFAFNVETMDGTHAYSRFQFQVEVSQGSLTVLNADRLPSRWNNNLDCFDGECIDHTSQGSISLDFYNYELLAKTIFVAVKTSDPTSITFSQEAFGDYPIFRPKILDAIFVNENVASDLITYRVPMPSNAKSFNVSIIPLISTCPIRLLFRSDNAPCSNQSNDRLCSMLTWRSLPLTTHFTFDASTSISQQVFPPNRYFYLAVEKVVDDQVSCQYSISVPEITFCNASQIFVSRDGFEECVDSYSIILSGNENDVQNGVLMVTDAPSVVAISVAEGTWLTPNRITVNLTTDRRITDVKVIAVGIDGFLSCGIYGTQMEQDGSQWSYSTMCPFPTGEWFLLVSLDGEGNINASMASDTSCSRGYDCQAALLTMMDMYWDDYTSYFEGGSIIRSPTNSSGRIHPMNPYFPLPASWQVLPLGSASDIQIYIQGYGYPDEHSPSVSPGQIVVMSNQDFISYTSWTLLIISSVPYMVVVSGDPLPSEVNPLSVGSIWINSQSSYWGGSANATTDNEGWVHHSMFEPVAINSEISLPFSYSFGSQAFSSIYINSQCLIAFEPFTIPRLLPQPPWTEPNPYPTRIIAPWWGDLDLVKGGQVQVLSGDDTFVIQFIDVPSQSDPNTLSTFQVTLYSTTDTRVSFLYTQLDSGATKHVLGVRDADGFAMAFFGQSPPTLNITNQVFLGNFTADIVFIPNPDPTGTATMYSPYDPNSPYTPDDSPYSAQSIPTSHLLMEILIPIGIALTLSLTLVVLIVIYYKRRRDRNSTIAGVENITQDLEAKSHVIDISNGVAPAGASPKSSPKMKRTPNTPRRRRHK
eukprot:TRINITY_DN4221_c0_g1_i2.p1 TRINITY_DN4221_c0_g1~~TRINITY_DN4221_c0_g1_i2.p1  ORF type:complete len:1114 (+),score=193.56 TRINITY_DN4221_c0_g1_i2:148-3489(+)